MKLLKDFLKTLKKSVHGVNIRGHLYYKTIGLGSNKMKEIG